MMKLNYNYNHNLQRGGGGRFLPCIEENGSKCSPVPPTIVGFRSMFVDCGCDIIVISYEVYRFNDLVVCYLRSFHCSLHCHHRMNVNSYIAYTVYIIIIIL